MKQGSEGFADRVYMVVSKIPKGRVSTYKEVARALNSRAYRAVGNALNKNPYAPKVACHRVVNSTGFVGGFATGINNKISLLRKEGVNVQNKMVDLRKYMCYLK